MSWEKVAYAHGGMRDETDHDFAIGVWRLKDLIAQADTRHGLEMAALERRYQERIKQMQRDHHAEVTRLESAIAHQAEQVRGMAAYGVKSESYGDRGGKEDAVSCDPIAQAIYRTFCGR